MNKKVFVALWLAAPLLQAQPMPDPAAVAPALQRLLEAQVQADGPGLAVLVARGDAVLFRSARGMAQVEHRVPLRADHVFRIGSVTKQFAAAALLQQVDAGRARLDDPLARWLPAYPNATGITLAQLLNHTAGVPNYTAIPGYMDGPIRQDLDTPGLVDVFRARPADFPPGTAFRYSNSGYVLVGAVLEATTGQPWHQAVGAMLQPLGLTQTRWGDQRQVVPGLAEGYARGEGGRLQRAAPISMTQPHAAGGLLGTVDDLWRWNQALHGGRVLSADSYRRMNTPEGAAGPARYGYGIARGQMRSEPLLQHSGGIHGYRSMLLVLPRLQLTVAVLANSDSGGPDLGLLAVQMAAHALGQPYPDGPTVLVPAVELARLAGRWRLLGGDAERLLRVQGDTLVSQRGSGPALQLRPIAGGLWLFEGSLSRFEPEPPQTPAEGARSRLFQGGEGEGEVWERVGDLPTGG